MTVTEHERAISRLTEENLMLRRLWIASRIEADELRIKAESMRCRIDAFYETRMDGDVLNIIAERVTQEIDN